MDAGFEHVIAIFEVGARFGDPEIGARRHPNASSDDASNTEPSFTTSKYRQMLEKAGAEQETKKNCSRAKFLMYVGYEGYWEIQSQQTSPLDNMG